MSHDAGACPLCGATDDQRETHPIKPETARALLATEPPPGRIERLPLTRYRVRAARDAASIFTEAMRKAIERQRITAPDEDTAALALLLALGLSIEPEPKEG